MSIIDNASIKNVPAKIADIHRLCEGLGQLRIMEVCGTHTVSIMRNGIRSLLPDNIQLISGPGCPVCVTCQGYIDAACKLALNEDVVVCTYGDMMTVPGNGVSLADLKTQGCDVRVVYSPREVLKYALKEPEKRFVFLAIGFETTVPVTAGVLLESESLEINNFQILCSHKKIVPAMYYLLEDGESIIDAFLCPGNVSVIIGADAYLDVSGRFNKPCVVTGFEPEQIINGIHKAIELIVDPGLSVANEYRSVVSCDGNRTAQKIIESFFEVCDSQWRAMGVIPKSGLKLKKEFEKFDACVQFALDVEKDNSEPGCKCGDVIQGKRSPQECGLFGKQCTPSSPYGPCMVSSEGTCAAWYKFGFRK